MKASLVVVGLLVVSSAHAEDLRVRQRAIYLLERGNAVTTPIKLPDLERVDRFRTTEFSGSKTVENEGTFTRVVIQGSGRRDEAILGDYHLVDVFVNGGMSRMQTQALAPAEVKTVMRITPIYHVSFNNEDVVNEVKDREIDGRPAKCIEFSTVTGEKSNANEICVDAESGALVLEKLNEERIEFHDFFVFAGALIPARIDYQNTTSTIGITQSMTEMTEATPNVLVAPPGSQAWVNCRSFRRAFGKSMPQPKPGRGTGEVDVVVRGVISADGKIHDAVVQSSGRPDLNTEALNVIHLWVFTPPMCDNQPTSVEGSFTLRFQGR